MPATIGERTTVAHSSSVKSAFVVIGHPPCLWSPTLGRTDKLRLTQRVAGHAMRPTSRHLDDCGRGIARRHGVPAAGDGRCLEPPPILSSTQGQRAVVQRSARASACRARSPDYWRPWVRNRPPLSCPQEVRGVASAREWRTRPSPDVRVPAPTSRQARCGGRGRRSPPTLAQLGRSAAEPAGLGAPGGQRRRRARPSRGSR